MDDTTNDGAAGDDPVELETPAGDPGDDAAIRLAQAVQDWARRLEQQGRPDAAMALYREVAVLAGGAPQPGAFQLVVRALTDLAAHLGVDNRVEDEVATYDEIVRRYDRFVAATSAGAGPPAELRAAVAGILNEKGLVLRDHQQLDRALAAYEELLARFRGDTSPLVRKWVANVHNGRSYALHELGRVDEAFVAFDEAVALLGDDPDVDVSDQVFHILANKVAALAGADRFAEVIAVYDDLNRRYDQLVPRVEEGRAAVLHKSAASVAFNLAEALQKLGRIDDALAAYDRLVAFCDEIMRRHGAAVGLDLRKAVGDALVEKAVILSEKLHRPDDALAVYADVVARLHDADDGGSWATTAVALLNAGEILGEQKRSGEAFAVYDDIVARYDRWVAAVADEATELPSDLREWVARALGDKGQLLARHEQCDQALASCEEALVRFGDDPDPWVRSAVAGAHQGRAQVLAKLGRLDDAIAAFDHTVAVYDDDTEPATQEAVCEAVAHKVSTLVLARRPDETMALRDELIRRYDELVAESDDPPREGVRRSTAAALIAQAGVHAERQQSDAARATYDAVLTRFRTDDDPEVQTAVKQASESADG